MDITNSEINYSFTKEVIGVYKMEGYEILYDCEMYKLFKGGILEGQFFYSEKVCFIGAQNYDARINIKERFFKNSDYMLIDNKTDEKIGSYHFSKWVNGSMGKIGTLTIGYETYNLRMQCRM